MPLTQLPPQEATIIARLDFPDQPPLPPQAVATKARQSLKHRGATQPPPQSH